MPQNQSFSIAPNGVVRGGAADYSADLGTGIITYDATINLPLWQSKKTNGAYNISPDDLLSNKLVLGYIFTVGGVSFTVTDVKPGQVTVSISVFNSNIKGQAVLDTNNTYFKIISLSATGSISGITFNLLLTPTLSKLQKERQQ